MALKYLNRTVVSDGIEFHGLADMFEYLANDMELDEHLNSIKCEFAQNEIDRYISNPFKSFYGFAALADYFADQCERIQALENERQQAVKYQFNERRFKYFAPLAKNFIIEIEKIQNILLT